MKKNNLKLNLVTIKIIFVFIILIVTSAETYSQKWVSRKVEKRKVVLEEFTGIHCGNCPDGHKIADNMALANQDKIFLVNVHTGVYANPSKGEIDLRTDDGNALGAGMRPERFPTATVSRELFNAGGKTEWFVPRNYWSSIATQMLQDDAPVNIATKARLNPENRKLTVEVELYYTSDCEADNYITVMLTQNNILGEQAGASTFYPENMANGKYKHNHVLRKILSNSGYAGDPVTQTKAGHYEYRKYEWVLPESIQTIPVVIEDLEVVAHVSSNIAITAGTYRTPMRIYNAAASKISTSSFEELPKLALFEMFTNASSTECAILNETEGLNKYLKSNTDKVIPVIYHTGTQGADPMYDFDNSFSYQRSVNYYSSTTVPSVIVDGDKVSNLTKAGAEAAINSASKSSMMSISTNSSIDESGKLKIDIGVNSQEAFTNLSLRVVVVEAGVFFDKPAGTNGEKEFCFVARHMLPNATGTPFGIASNGNRSFNFEKQLDLTKLNKNNIYVVVFVQDETNKKVLQAVATKKVEFLSVEITPAGNIYSKVVAGSQKLHTFEIKNTSNVPVTVTLVPEALTNDWEYQPEAPTTKNIAAGATVNIPYGTKCVTSDASISASGYEILITGFTPSKDFNNGVAVYSPSKKINFVDITSNAKSAYIYGDGICNNESATNNIMAFTSGENSTLLADFVAIPFYSEELFTSNILDDFEFLGITIDENNSEALIKTIPTALQKFTALIGAGKKIYFSAAKQFEVVSQNKSKYPLQTKAITDFYKNQFGVTNSEVKTTNGDVIKIISDNNNFHGEYDLFANKSGASIDLFTVSGTSNAAIFKTLTDNKPVAICSNNLYDETKNRRILLGFDLGVSSTIDTTSMMANQMLLWLFGKDTSIEDVENNLSKDKNNINIYLSNNIISSSSNANLVINNSNTGINNIKIYLLDMSLSKVKNIYEGDISMGNNYYEIKPNISTGKYFLIVETLSGKTCLPIIIIK